MSIKNPRWLPPQDESFNIGPYDKKDINPETRNLIKPKKYMNSLWMVPYKKKFGCVNRISKMDTTTGQI